MSPSALKVKEGRHKDTIPPMNMDKMIRIALVSLFVDTGWSPSSLRTYYHLSYHNELDFISEEPYSCNSSPLQERETL